MESNLTPEFVEFIKTGGDLNALVQSVIDRAQYLPGFLERVQSLIDEFEDPFEEIPTEPVEVVQRLLDDEPVELKATQTGAIMEKRLKAAYCK